MIDLSKEQPITASQVARLAEVKVNGRAPHVATIHRWIMPGIVGPDGDRIRLETVRTPRGRVTSREAVRRFFAALGGDDDPAEAIDAEQDADAAERELAATGF